MQEDLQDHHDGMNDGRPDDGRVHDDSPMDAAPAAGNAAAGVEAQLRAQEAFYRNIIEGAADVTTLLAPDGTILYASAAMAESTSLGYAPKEVIGRNSLEIIHPDDRAAVAQAIANDLAGRPTTVEGRARRRDGSWMWVEMRGKAIVGLDGRKMVVAYSRDINQRKHLQERLKKSEEYYKSLLRGSSDLITVIDESGILVFASDSVQKILGYRVDEVLGQQIFSYFHPDDLALASQRFREASEANSSLTELRVRRKDGSWCTCEGTGRMVTSPDGRRMVVIITRDISERKRVDREHALLAAIVNASSDAIIGFSKDLLITSWNPAAERLYGYSSGEALGRAFDLFVSADQLPQALAADQRMFETGMPETFEQISRRKDGSSFTSLVNIFPIRDLDGNVISGAGIGRDITERNRVERENAALAAIVESSDDAITSIAPDLTITYWNRAAERMFGFTAAESIGHPFTRNLAPESYARSAEIIERLMKRPDEVVRFEGPAHRKDGAYVEASTVCFAIRDRAGRVAAISAIQRDITERRRAERETAFFAALVNASRDAIINVSSEARITTWNPAAERVYGYTAEEAIGKGIELFVPADELPETIERVRRVVKTGQPESWEEHARNRDGTSFVSAINIFPILDSAGNVSSVAGIGRDITALKETERELVAAREAALAASQAKSEFLASMSHEIRTPMTAILGMTELLGEGPLTAEQRRYIEILGNNGRALLDLINSILDLAKIESGRLTLEHVAFDLGDVVGKSAQTLAIRAHAKGLELIVSIAPEVPAALLGDPLRLRQVLINLIGNAIKFTERGEVLVSVERASAPGEPLRLKFSVRDTGIGIARDKLPLLFAAFSQADTSTARKYGGSGLGLAIVKRLVDLMGGEVTIESEPGKGSIFSFTAPFEQPDAPAATPWPDMRKVGTLIVDNNETGRTVLHRIFSGRGASVTEAASYEAGLTAIRQAVSNNRPPRILLLSDRIESSGANALELLVGAASQCGASTIAMIHCDNLAADISRRKSLKLETYLVKPIDMRELVKVMGTAIGRPGDEAHPQRPRLAGESHAPIVDRPLRILFADDSIDNRTLIRAFLKKTPYRLDEAEDGGQAIDGFIAAGGYDLVLMDIQMPGVDGYAATRAIRQWERDHNLAHTQIIALTASVFPEAIRLAREAGCDAHLGKPLTKTALLRAIHDAIRGPEPAPAGG